MIFTRKKTTPAAPQNIDGVTWCAIPGLYRQRHQVRLLVRRPQNVHARQAGAHQSVHKGRGMDFSESRIYQSGDDVRFLDWRVTARTGKLHTKLFAEEKERPSLLLVDLRSSMFFGTQRCFKSVLAAETASLLAWQSCQAGDNIGAMLLTPTGLIFYPPARSQAALSRLLAGLSQATRNPPRATDIAEPRLSAALQRLGALISAGTQCTLISDFNSDFHACPTAELQSGAQALAQQLAALSRRITLRVIAISDPLESTLASAPLPLALRQAGQPIHLSATARQQLRQDYQHWQNAREQLLTQLRQQSYQGQGQWLMLSTADSPAQRLAALARIP